MSIWAVLGKILFVGHSLVGPQLPPMIEAGLARMDRPAVVQAQIINGAPLSYNWENGAQAEGVDARAELATGGVDVLILTEGMPLASNVEWNDTAAQVAAYAALARSANPATRVFLYETWHSLQSGAGATEADPGAGVPWRDRLTADLPVWEQIAADASAHPQGLPVTLIPAGQAMGRLADEIAAGRVPGLASIADVFADDIHPNGKGLYFLAMVHLAAITGTSPEGLPPKLMRSWPSRDAVIAEDTALALQKIAHAAVTDHAARRPAARTTAARTTVAGPMVAADPAPRSAADATAPETAPLPAFAPVTNPALSLNLAGVHDWSVQQPFLDLMKTARPWTGHLPGQWGGWDHDRLAAAGVLDENGWPRRLPAELTGLATLVLTDLPPDAGGVAGRYVLRWTGRAEVAVSGRGQVADSAPGQIVFDYSPGEGAVIVTVSAIDPADPLRDMTIVRQDRAPLLEAGQIFNPDWLARIRGVRGLRFMDWMATNNATLATVADRPRTGHYTWARQGVPVEVMVALANELQAEPWFTVPHLADDALVADMAAVVARDLDPGLKAWVEFSNEVWNWQFAQATWAEEQGRARWGQDSTWVQFHALRAGQVAAIWTDAFGLQAKDRLVRVIATQTGWKGLEEMILTAPLVMAEGAPAPAAAFDAYAVTGYVSGGLVTPELAPVIKGWLAESQAAAESAASAQGLTGQAAADHVAAHRFDLAVARAVQEIRDGSVTGQPMDTLQQLLTDTLPWHAAVAQRHGLRLVMYEGGLHSVGLGPVVEDAAITAFLNHLAYAPQVGALYTDLLAGWARLGDAPFAAFNDVYTPNKWGSWGALRHLGDDNPRWQALAAGCGPC